MNAMVNIKELQKRYEETIKQRERVEERLRQSRIELEKTKINSRKLEDKTNSLLTDNDIYPT